LLSNAKTVLSPKLPLANSITVKRYSLQTLYLILVRQHFIDVAFHQNAISMDQPYCGIPQKPLIEGLLTKKLGHI
jgi:hypothetical protein